MNRVCRLARRVRGPVTRDTFEFSDQANSPLAEGQLRIETAYVSLDPHRVLGRARCRRAQSRRDAGGIGAAGAVGQVVGRLAKIAGARAVGIAGGPGKCHLLVEEFGFDVAVDYKADGFADALAVACPEGIDVDFENVGGDVFDAVLAQMTRFGRVALCGLKLRHRRPSGDAGRALHRWQPWKADPRRVAGEAA